MSKKAFDFEKKLQQLEEIAEALSEGDLPLEKAIDRYAEGIALFKACSQYLDGAEKRVTQIVEQLDGDLVEEPFEDQAAFDDPGADQ
jgi:exodeoxyribonuclease VII small subunit